MRGRRTVWIVGLLLATLGAAAVGARASSTTHASTFDKTFSCRVRHAHFINLTASSNLPPMNGNQQQPGGLYVTTAQKTRVVKGAVITLTQMSLSARKDSLRIDLSTCNRVRRQIPLKAKGLPGPPFTVTPRLRGFDNERCGTADRVLVRLQFRTTNGVPSHALLAVRNDNAKSRPVAFYNWSPSKVYVYTAGDCVSS